MLCLLKKLRYRQEEKGGVEGDDVDMRREGHALKRSNMLTERENGKQEREIESTTANLISHSPFHFPRNDVFV